ncbi:hypothetical protein MYSTI_07579 [Myxococcus stipitatus DSM 14675]|uniref:Lipoprotein n=1 Tax=Myxococcus stipitatus (strain DSM 14675 / JCM 12634 / Mx s8) TaxID=1278073 RepID=L7UIQ4_MYXSD|nr:hypothetical protein [Myxococcus stipitatus]AGC48851.1 hypothetical protein MYSTI_07579 [Myxococcus stipitatus DSM 14675]
MIRRLLGASVGVAVLVAAWACGGSDKPGPDSTGEPEPPASEEDAGTDGGPEDDGGTQTPEPPDAGPPDAGEPPLPPKPEGPWPTDPLTNYSSKYAIPKVVAMGVDAAHNLWFLNRDRIGVLRAGTDKVLWNSQPIGQASRGFGTSPDNLATNSRVICGGKAGEAYVGYEAVNDIPGGQRIAGRGEADFSEERYLEFQKGDVDAVTVSDDGTDIVLREHLFRSKGTSRPSRNEPIGIRNSNDFHYDEDRSVYSCVRVMQGPYEGEVYVGTNHGVTRIRGYEYSSHRHPAYWVTTPTGGRSQRAGYTFGLGISKDGDLLIANDWKIGILPPNAALEWWDSEERKPEMPAGVEPALYTLNTFVDPVNPGNDETRGETAPFNFWRAFQQTADGSYYVGGLGTGLWQFQANPQRHNPSKLSDSDYVRVQGANTDDYTALAATRDGSLFVGTADHGLWRLTPTKQLEKVSGVSGAKVQQLIYDARVTPGALYALVDGKLYVLRGY